jgi:cytochrome c2
MALLSDGTMLLTVGDLAYRREGLHELTNSYGKVWRIDLETGEASLFTLGHRNPQGLYASGSRVWETEHGPKGGDEVNLLEEGGNYGWPFATYGTGYNQFAWSLSQKHGSHEQFDLPLIAWSPSVGVSSLIQITGERFPVWTGDLLVGTLRAESLLRLHVEGERVVSSEQIHLGRRVRDLVETDAGHIVLLTDSRSPNDQGSIVIVDRRYEPSETALVEAYPSLELCATCHTFGEGMGDGVGPNLWGVLGSPVASRPRFVYSPALLQIEGRWTETRVRALLTDPEFAPGTSMPAQPGLSDGQVEQILSALRSLQ